MWPPGKFEDAPKTAWSNRPGSSNQSKAPEGAENVLDTKMNYWQRAGAADHHGPIGRGQMLEVSRSRDPDGEHRYIASQRTGPTYDDTNLFKTEEQLSDERRRWQQLLGPDGPSKPKETYPGEVGDIERAMDPFSYKGTSSDFQLKDDDFPPL